MKTTNEENWLLDYADHEYEKAERQFNRAARLREYVRALVQECRDREVTIQTLKLKGARK